MDDRTRVAELLGRVPQGEFDVVVRDPFGDPVVIRNAPVLDDGTPMPTRFYLVGTELVRAVSRLEADGAVRRAEGEIAADEIADVHARYAAERDAALPADHAGPRPTGGVGGTRVGLKCLHAHVAHELAGGSDPVGRWALDQIVVADPTVTVTFGTTVMVTIGDDVTSIETDRRATFDMPLGARSLLDDELAGADPPTPAMLTNALGIVTDYIDDLIREDPAIVGTASIIVAGDHAMMLARVEIGDAHVPARYCLQRSDAEEVFRLLVTEPAQARRDNPGLDPGYVESIVATCCIVLALFRRFDVDTVSLGVR